MMVLLFLLSLLIFILLIVLFLQRFKKVKISYHDQSQLVEQHMNATDFVNWVEGNERF